MHRGQNWVIRIACRCRAVLTGRAPGASCAPELAVNVDGKPPCDPAGRKTRRRWTVVP